MLAVNHVEHPRSLMLIIATNVLIKNYNCSCHFGAGTHPAFVMFFNIFEMFIVFTDGTVVALNKLRRLSNNFAKSMFAHCHKAV